MNDRAGAERQPRERDFEALASNLAIVHSHPEKRWRFKPTQGGSGKGRKSVCPLERVVRWWGCVVVVSVDAEPSTEGTEVSRPSSHRFLKPSSLLIRGLVLEAHRLVYHSTLGLRVMEKKKKTLHSHSAAFSATYVRPCTATDPQEPSDSPESVISKRSPPTSRSFTATL